MYNVYVNDEFYASTEYKIMRIDGLEAGTDYKVSVEREENGVKSDRIHLNTTTDTVTVEPEPEPEPVEPETLSADISDYHTGGGYYELPNGDKVRGKDNAVEVLERLLDE